MFHLFLVKNDVFNKTLKRVQGLKSIAYFGKKSITVQLYFYLKTFLLLIFSFV